MKKLAGSFVNVEDGIKTLHIEHFLTDSGMYGGWNGIVRYFPAIGDWTVRPRCRIFGTDLVVEYVSQGETTIAKQFVIVNADTIVGKLDPWKGTFRRSR